MAGGGTDSERKRGRKAPRGSEAPRKRAILERSEVFATLSDDARTEVERRSALVEAERRSTLAREPPGVFVLGSGRVRLLRRGGDRDITLAYHGAGSVIGEGRVVDPEDPSEIVTTERVEAVHVSASLVRRLLGRETKFAARFSKLAIERRLAVEHRFEGLLVRNVESRVAEFLLEGARRYGVPNPLGTLIGVKFTHSEIASYVGSTRETVTLVLGQLKREGVIETDHRRVVVKDRERLRART